MQTKSELFESIRRSEGYIVRTRAEIGGVEYLQGAGLVHAATSGSLFAENKPSVGSCVSREVDIIIRNPQNFPKRAKIRLFSRVELGDQVSEWLPKGVFYIDTRDPDDVARTLTIHGYDAMLLYGGETYLKEGDTGEWPRACDVVVADICSRMDLELDERTVLDSSITIPYPNDWTIRELLGYIGVAQAGNWTITDEGKLRLVPLWSIPDETYYLVDEHGDPITFGGDRIVLSDAAGTENPNASGAEKTYLGPNVERLGTPPAFQPYSKVIVWYDDENAFTAGDDTGRTLEADLPFATQEIADKMLAAIQGYAYQPYEGERAILDPAAELGDGVTVNGVYSVLARIDTTFNALCTADVSAPADEEIDHELPYQSPTQLALKRKVTLGKSYYGTTITQQRGLEVVKVDADGNEVKRAQFNADVLAMYDERGRKRIYFDTDTGEFFFEGNVAIHGGSMNINENFVVDEDGNATLTGAWLKAAVLYASSNSQYYAQMLGDAFALMSKDSDVPRAIIEATESMVQMILGVGSDESGVNGRLYVQKGVEGGQNVARVKYINANGEESSVTFSDNEGVVVESGKIAFHGEVDFSNATVTGLT